MEDNLNAYNFYIVKKPSNFIDNSRLLDFILSEFIVASRTSSVRNIFYCYTSLYYGSHRHIKTEKNYELYRLIYNLVKAYLEDSHKIKSETLYGNIQLFVDLLNKGYTLTSELPPDLLNQTEE